MTTPALSNIATYDLEIVWSTGTDADTSAYDHPHYSTPPGLRIDGLGRAQQRAFGPPGTPALDCTLLNTDGIYSPGGSLGSFVGRGPETSVTAGYGVDVLGDASDVLGDAIAMPGDGRFETALFTGTIDTSPQSIDRVTANVQIRALGRMSLLVDKSPVIAVYENIRTDQAIALILDAVGWPVDARVLDAGDTTILYFWANGTQSAASLINAILAAEGSPAAAFETGAGVFHFEGRQFRANNRRSTDVQWTLVDGPIGSGNPTGDDPFTLGDSPVTFGDGRLTTILYHLVPSRWDSNPDEVVADVKAVVNVRTPTAVMKIWEWGGPLVLSASEVRDLEATSPDPFKSAVVPAAGAVTTVAITGTPTGGSITVNVNGEPTVGIAYNAAAATVQTFLEALSNVAPGDVVVTGGPGPGAAWVLTWSEAFALSPITVSASGAGLTGGSSPAASAATFGVDFTVVAGSLVSVSLLETSGQKVRIRMIAGAGGATVNGVTSNGPQLRAVSLPVTTTAPVTSTVNVALSSARFRPKDYTIPIWPEITANQALDLCNNHARRYQRPRDQMTVTVGNISATALYFILTVAPSDRLRIIHTHGGIDASFFVEQLHHDLSRGGGLHTLTLACERVTDDVPARFGTARFDFDAFSE